MLNSNMQCSRHGNGGSSEASHGAENVCFGRVFACKSVCVCTRAYICVEVGCTRVSMRLCICAKVRHKMQSKFHWSSSTAGKGV